MSGIHTPFLGGTGFTGMADSGADSALAPPFVPGEEAAPVHEEAAAASDEEGPDTAAESGFPATPAATTEQQSPEDDIADWAQDIIELEETELEETELEEPALGFTPDAESPVPDTEHEAVEEPVEAEASEEGAESESDYPDFLFGGSSGEHEGETPVFPPDHATEEKAQTSPASSPSPAARLDPETRERIRALARELGGEDAAEDVIARAFEEGYRKAREEGQT